MAQSLMQRFYARLALWHTRNAALPSLCDVTVKDNSFTSARHHAAQRSAIIQQVGSSPMPSQATSIQKVLKEAYIVLFCLDS